MAVENKYVNPEIAASKAPNTAQNMGAKVVRQVITFEVAVADDDLSVYRVIKGIPWNAIITGIAVMNDAITLGTDYDIGIYESSTDDVDGAVVDRELFASTLDLSSANGRGAALDGLENVLIEDIEKPIFILAGETLKNHKSSYDLAITAVTVGTSVGTISLIVDILQG